MKKITSILALFLMCFGMAVQAAPTDMPEFSSEGKTVWYSIKSFRSQKYLSYSEVEQTTMQSETKGLGAMWCLVPSGDGVLLRNASNDLNLTAEWDLAAAGQVWHIIDHGFNKDGLAICKNATIQGEDCIDANNYNNYIGTWAPVEGDNAGTTWIFEKVTDFSSFFDIPALKNSVLASLESWKGLSAIFSADYLQSVASQVAAVEGGSTLESMKAATLKLQAIEAGIWKALDGKTVRFTSFGRDQNNGHDMVFRGNGLVGVSNTGDAGLWTLSSLGNGNFSMHNFMSNLYVAPAGGQSAQINGTEEAKEAGVYHFVLQGENLVNLKNGGKTIHLNNNNVCVEWSHEDNTAPSQFKVFESDPISVSYKDYAAAKEMSETILYELQKSYGLVQDPSMFLSNAKEKSEGSYEALLDGNPDNFFHSAWQGDESKIPVHDIRAELIKPVESFFFYMKERNNHRNRPVELLIEGSNDDKNYEPIQKVTTTMKTTADFMSDEIKCSQSYKYIRFKVLSTNTGTNFFTMSEFYLLPGNEDVLAISECMKNLKVSITDPAYGPAARTLVAKGAAIMLNNSLKKAYEVLNACEAEKNYAEVPALGQYPTAAFEKAKAIVKNATNNKVVDAAIEEFLKTLNAPVYVLNSAAVKKYCEGAAALWDNDWKWASSNKYNHAMWFKANGKTSAEVAAGVYNFVNWTSNSSLKGVDKIQVMPIGETGAFNLKCGAGNMDYLHCQNGGALVYWGASGEDLSTGNNASAWKFEYLGNSFDLNMLSQYQLELIQALEEAYPVYSLYEDATFGNGLGECKGDKKTFLAALSELRQYMEVNKTLTDWSKVPVEKLEQLKFDFVDNCVLNMPKFGEFYRIKNVYGEYLTSPAVAGQPMKFNTTENVANIIYRDYNSFMLMYKNGQYMNGLNLGEMGETYAVEVAASPVVGKYSLVAPNKQYMMVDEYGNFVFGEDPKLDGAAWTFEYVDSIPVVIPQSKHAAFCSPVPVKMPKGVKAYTGKLNGSEVELVEVVGTVPATTPVVLIAAKKGTYDLAVDYEFTGSAIEDNDLRGTEAAFERSEGVYVLDAGDHGMAYYRHGNVVKGFSSYIYSSQYVDYFSVKVNDIPTGIESVVDENKAKTYYDLNGRRVLYPSHGVYVTGEGKKVYIK